MTDGGAATTLPLPLLSKYCIRSSFNILPSFPVPTTSCRSICHTQAYIHVNIYFSCKHSFLIHYSFIPFHKHKIWDVTLYSMRIGYMNDSPCVPWQPCVLPAWSGSCCPLVERTRLTRLLPPPLDAPRRWLHPPAPQHPLRHLFTHHVIIIIISITKTKHQTK